jgi:RNA recognition motif-containing protein
MEMNIYVGNLARGVNDDDLRGAFEAYGQVESATVIKDRFSGESRGFGFVEMPTKAEAQSAIDGLNGTDLKGRTINVNEARPRPEGRRGGGRRGGGGRRF